MKNRKFFATVLFSLLISALFFNLRPVQADSSFTLNLSVKDGIMTAAAGARTADGKTEVKNTYDSGQYVLLIEEKTGDGNRKACFVKKDEKDKAHCQTKGYLIDQATYRRLAEYFPVVF
ncbi:MAG: hypothetical protein A3J65_03475 [Candidatus Buchananbacteria bacterium RIFCSPHIGHO2_02_FULL_45_11b]|uniref:Uncharacterized protein n=4 Tax=Candidatus Buchananiibacteriota TaxID=1817903 RepID=A0A1G1YP69_9BACT|nr:MAG: hypothetical protein A2663_01605 [Candidatus Buchananbacteria bacterium RIFCSPHIGHO2_01_FULL_46_12]OGY51874.1 MAG: hypothetical protein A3J65_03475 [Candidatus Buchananbacteria bacterium RIFCSPHIGHO2_02_FULL_45_11b]OGY54158.1 MAG: hypothetical protein A3B15_00010 [Candidatus Buchananbacteria bacterium RIFCSPLOWO2_01_FULL_45_31]OGY56071.1 MAG: hypothetical protein A3H67_04130 [Candidatus Buchananbacteria bacterium RIFCSPLOWO2_02_FULL_46_11b]